MKILRFKWQDQILWGQLDETNPHWIFPTKGPDGERDAEHTAIPLSEIGMLPPAEPTKIICVGRNYLDHIKEMGHATGELPKEPGVFLKGPNTLAAHEDTILYPTWTQDLHFEGELALVIGKPGKHIRTSDALDHILGYTCALDLTARDRQRSDLQWTRAKGSDQFCPLGPWLETDLDSKRLEIQTRVNGIRKQHAWTNQMIFDIPTLVSYISEFMTLERGDVILTGTPSGVGPLAARDKVEVEIEGIGCLRVAIEEPK